jgi:cytochrome c oxidase cbb3-type subunit 3
MRKNKTVATLTRICCVFLAASLLFVLAALTASAQQEAPPDPAIERGHKLFQQSCGFCHGADATGARGPDLVRSPLVAHDVAGDKIRDVIRQGRPDKGMPPLSLTEEQIKDVAAYLHARAAEGLNSGDVPSTYPAEKLLTGNREAGKSYFNGAGGCGTCHSPTGDLAGIAAKYPAVDLQSKMLYPGGRHTIAIVTLPSGEQIKGPLAHADDFTVALRAPSGWYRSFPRDAIKVEFQDNLAAHRELLTKISPAEMHNLFAYLESLK